MKKPRVSSVLVTAVSRFKFSYSLSYWCRGTDGDWFRVVVVCRWFGFSNTYYVNGIKITGLVKYK